MKRDLKIPTKVHIIGSGNISLMIEKYNVALTDNRDVYSLMADDCDEDMDVSTSISSLNASMSSSW